MKALRGTWVDFFKCTHANCSCYWSISLNFRSVLPHRVFTLFPLKFCFSLSLVRSHLLTAICRKWKPKMIGREIFLCHIVLLVCHKHFQTIETIISGFFPMAAGFGRFFFTTTHHLNRHSIFHYHFNVFFFNCYSFNFWFFSFYIKRQR